MEERSLFLLKRSTVLACVVISVTVLGSCAGGRTTTGPEPDRIRVMAYNIHHGEGMDEVLDLQRIADIILSANPDIVALQEVDSVVDRTNHVDQARRLAELTGMESRFGRFMEYQGGAYGMAILSKLPIVYSENLRLPDGTEPRSSVLAQVVLPNSRDTLDFVGIHFYETATERLAQAQSLSQQLSRTNRLSILAGDFNSTPGSQVMEFIGDNWTLVDKGEDNLTFSSFQPEREIDFFAYRPGGRFKILSQELLDEPVASDHKPLVMDVEIIRN